MQQLRGWRQENSGSTMQDFWTLTVALITLEERTEHIMYQEVMTFDYYDDLNYYENMAHYVEEIDYE